MSGITTDSRADVAVVGLGSAGVMAAWRLSRISGLSVLGFEQFGRVHAHAGYAGESRLFRVAYHEGEHYVPWLLRARQLWHELERVSGSSLLIPSGVLSIAESGRSEVENVLATARSHRLPHRVLSHQELARSYGQHRLDGREIAVLDELGGVLRSEIAVDAAHRAALAGGARLLTGEQVLHIEPGENDVTIQSRGSQGERTSVVSKVVVAAGSWTSALLTPTRALLDNKRLVLTWFLPERPLDFAVTKFPAFLRDHDDVHLFGAPALDGWSVKVATTDRWGLADRREVGPEELTVFGRSVARLLPGLLPEPVRYSVHRDAYTADKTPIVAFSPHSPRVLVLAGFSGHGFKMSPAVGELAAGLVLGRIASSPFPWPVTPTSPPGPPIEGQQSTP